MYLALSFWWAVLQSLQHIIRRNIPTLIMHILKYFFKTIAVTHKWKPNESQVPGTFPATWQLMWRRANNCHCMIHFVTIMKHVIILLRATIYPHTLLWSLMHTLLIQRLLSATSKWQVLLGNCLCAGMQYTTLYKCHHFCGMSCHIKEDVTLYGCQYQRTSKCVNYVVGRCSEMLPSAVHQEQGSSLP